jgi:hypothetical protein
MSSLSHLYLLLTPCCPLQDCEIFHDFHGLDSHMGGKTWRSWSSEFPRHIARTWVWLQMYLFSMLIHG